MTLLQSIIISLLCMGSCLLSSSSADRLSLAKAHNTIYNGGIRGKEIYFQLGEVYIHKNIRHLFPSGGEMSRYSGTIPFDEVTVCFANKGGGTSMFVCPEPDTVAQATSYAELVAQLGSKSFCCGNEAPQQCCTSDQFSSQTGGKKETDKISGLSTFVIVAICVSVVVFLVIVGVVIACACGICCCISNSQRSNMRVVRPMQPYVQPSGGFLRPQPSGGFQQPQPSGGFLRPQPSGGFQQPQPSGGFQQPQPSGGFQQPQPSGGFQQPQPSGGFQQPQPSGGFLQPQPSGGFLQPQPSGGFLQPQPYGGFQQPQPSGGFLRPQPSGGFLQPQPYGGFQQPQPSPTAPPPPLPPPPLPPPPIV